MVHKQESWWFNQVHTSMLALEQFCLNVLVIEFGIGVVWLPCLFVSLPRGLSLVLTHTSDFFLMAAQV